MILKQSTARNLMVWMADSTDHVTGKSGLTLTITASKDGAAFASISPTVTDLGSGWYNLALTTTHTNTLGAFALHITSAGADPTDTLYEVCVELPGVVADKTGFSLSAAGVQAIWDALTSALTTAGSIGKRLADDIDAAISTRLATSGYTAPDNSDIAAIKAKTDNLPTSPADETLVIAATNAIMSRIGVPVGADISHDIAAVGAAAATLGGIRKNVGVNGFPFRMFNNDGTPGLNLTVTGQVQLDGGAFANLTNAVVEVGNGWYKVNLANADVNGKLVALKFNGGTGVQETPFLIVTDT